MTDSYDAEDSREMRAHVHLGRPGGPVTDHLEHLRFNSAVAQLYTLSNSIGGADKANPSARREALEARPRRVRQAGPDRTLEVGHHRPGVALFRDLLEPGPLVEHPRAVVDRDRERQRLEPLLASLDHRRA